MKPCKPCLVIAAALVAMPIVFSSAAPVRHDPRTTARKFSQSLEIDGAGSFKFDYKALHFNADMFTQAKGNDNFLNFLNNNVWGQMGSAQLEFEIQSEDETIEPGEYTFGVNMTKDNEFFVVFWSGKEKVAEIPFETEEVKRTASHLAFTMLATDDVDTFVLEARCGPYLCTVDFTVPYLDPDHDEDHQ